MERAYQQGFQGDSAVKNLPANAVDLGLEDPLQKAVAPHSSILAWEIPWTEESGRISMGVTERVGCDLATKH